MFGIKRKKELDWNHKEDFLNKVLVFSSPKKVMVQIKQFYEQINRK